MCAWATQFDTWCMQQLYNWCIVRPIRIRVTLSYFSMSRVTLSYFSVLYVLSEAYVIIFSKICSSIQYGKIARIAFVLTIFLFLSDTWLWTPCCESFMPIIMLSSGIEAPSWTAWRIPIFPYESKTTLSGKMISWWAHNVNVFKRNTLQR